MKNLKIMRTENKFYICEDKEGKLFAIDMSEMPKDAVIGSNIQINNEGEISLVE